jgi:hypothetical protein
VSEITGEYILWIDCGPNTVPRSAVIAQIPE